MPYGKTRLAIVTFFSLSERARELIDDQRQVSSSSCQNRIDFALGAIELPFHMKI